MKNILIITAILFLSSCQKETITREGIIKEHFFLENDGAQMPVWVEGNIDSKKMLIMIHGGPGDGGLYYNIDEATDIAEQKFAVVYWDQRLAGAAQGNIPDADLGDYTEDLRKLIQLLRYRYGNEQQIYLLGHSWGGLLAPLFLSEGNQQDMVSGWIQADGDHNYALNDQLVKSRLISFGQQEISAGRNTSDWQEIVDYCQDHDPSDHDVSRKMNEYAHRAEELVNDIDEGHGTGELVSFFISHYQYPMTSFLANAIYNNFIGEIDSQAYDVDMDSRLPSIHTPTLLLWGEYDFVCPPAMMDDITERVSSTDISSHIFAHSGHSPMFNQPSEFWTTVTDWVAVH